MNRDRCRAVLSVTDIGGGFLSLRKTPFSLKEGATDFPGFRQCTRPFNHPGPCSVVEGQGGGVLPAYGCA